MAPVISESSAALKREVDARSRAAAATLAGYASLVATSLFLVLALVWATRRDLTARIRKLSSTMRRLADGDLAIAVPGADPPDELGEMADTLASFKTSLIERDRLAAPPTVAAAARGGAKARVRGQTPRFDNGVARRIRGPRLAEAH